MPQRCTHVGVTPQEKMIACIFEVHNYKTAALCSRLFTTKLLVLKTIRPKLFTAKLVVLKPICSKLLTARLFVLKPICSKLFTAKLFVLKAILLKNYLLCLLSKLFVQTFSLQYLQYCLFSKLFVKNYSLQCNPSLTTTPSEAQAVWTAASQHYSITVPERF